MPDYTIMTASGGFTAGQRVTDAQIRSAGGDPKDWETIGTATPVQANAESASATPPMARSQAKEKSPGGLVRSGDSSLPSREQIGDLDGISEDVAEALFAAQREKGDRLTAEEADEVDGIGEKLAARYIKLEAK